MQCLFRPIIGTLSLVSIFICPEWSQVAKPNITGGGIEVHLYEWLILWSPISEGILSDPGENEDSIYHIDISKIVVMMKKYVKHQDRDW